MSARQARVQLILEWMEKHPQVVARVEDKLRSLIGVYGNATRRIREVIPESDRLTRALQIAQDVFREQKAELILNTRSAEFMSEVLKRLTAEEKKLGSQSKQLASRLIAFGKFVTRISYRMGWFAFRTMVVGRILLSWILRPLRMGIRALTNWESSLDSAASALGLLATSGALTAKRSDILHNAILKLVKVGPKVQGAFQYFKSVLVSIAADAIQPFIPMVLKLADTIAGLWEQVSPKLVPALEELVSRILPPLIDLIEGVGPAIIEGFVQGLSIALPLIVDLLRYLKPILPMVSQLIGFLLPFAPILVGIGAALYILSPILTAVGIIMQGLGFILSGTVIPALGGFLSAIIPLLPVLLPLIAVIATAILVWKNWGAIIKWFNSVTKPLQPLFNALKELFSAVIHVLTGLGKIFYNVGRIIYELARIGFTKLWEILEPIRKLLADIANVIGTILEPAIKSITNAIRPLTDALKGLGDVLHGVGDYLGGVADHLAQLCFRHVVPYVALFTKRMSEAEESIAGVRAGLAGLGAGLTGLASPGLAFRGGTQEVTIYADVSIGSVTAEADLERVVDAVNEGLTEALRRRFLG